MMGGAFSLWHWLVVLLVVILVFGTKRLRGAGADLGATLRNFRDSLRAADTDEEEETESAQSVLEVSRVRDTEGRKQHTENQA